MGLFLPDGRRCSSNGAAPLTQEAAITTRLAIILALTFSALIVADQMLNHGTLTLFLAKKFADLIDWVAFWR